MRVASAWAAGTGLSFVAVGSEALDSCCAIVCAGALGQACPLLPLTPNHCCPTRSYPVLAPNLKGFENAVKVGWGGEQGGGLGLGLG